VEWNDFDLYVNGVKTSKVVEFEAGVKTDKEYLYGAGSKPISIQSGNKAYPGKVTILKEHVDVMWLAAVAASNGGDITDVSFDIIGAFRAKGSRTLSRIACSGCEVSEAIFRIAQNAKNVQVELPFLALDIKMLPATGAAPSTP
jgi:hypothetical protein